MRLPGIPCFRRDGECGFRVLSVLGGRRMRVTRAPSDFGTFPLPDMVSTHLCFRLSRFLIRVPGACFRDVSGLGYGFRAALFPERSGIQLPGGVSLSENGLDANSLTLRFRGRHCSAGELPLPIRAGSPFRPGLPCSPVGEITLRAGTSRAGRPQGTRYATGTRHPSARRRRWVR